MEKITTLQSHEAQFLNKTVLAINFIACMIYVVLVILLVRSEALDWGLVEIGWLMGIPVLVGVIVRLMLLKFDERRRRTLANPSLPGKVYHFRRRPGPTINDRRTESGREPQYSPQGTRV